MPNPMAPRPMRPIDGDFLELVVIDPIVCLA